MALEELENDFQEYGEEEEGEVDIDRELIDTLDEIERFKIKNRKQTEILLQYVKEESNSQEIIKLKVELEEEKKVEDILLQQMKEKNKECEILEEQVSTLR